MAFTDMNDVEHELGEEKPPKKNGNRTFLIIAGTLAGLLVLALLCIGGLAIFRFLPNQRAAQNATATGDAQSTAKALAVTQTAAIPTFTMTSLPTYTPTNTPKPTNTPRPTNTAIVVIQGTTSPTVDLAIATRDALLTQIASTHVITTQAGPSQVTATPTRTSVAASTTNTSTSVAGSTTKTSTPIHPTSTALPTTGIADELGTPGLLIAAFVLLAVIFLARRLRTAS